MIAESPSVPPWSCPVRTTTMLTLAPSPSQPATLQGQYFRPLRMYSSPSSSAVTPIPTGWGSGVSKFAVPPGSPAGSLTAYPTRYSPVGSEVAARRNLSFCSSVPQYQTGISPRPLTSTVQAKPGSTAQISSAARITSTFVSPPPPYSLGSMQNAIPRL
jgi:hypothetical protein